jgi:hypothetical protein
VKEAEKMSSFLGGETEVQIDLVARRAKVRTTSKAGNAAVAIGPWRIFGKR